MEKKKINSPFSRPDDREDFAGVDTGDTKLVDRQILLEFVQTGTDENGKAIGSVKPVVHETFKDVDELVMSHADQVGLINLINQYARTGDVRLFNQNTPLPSGDYSSVGTETAEEIYAKLPKELTNGLTMDQFLKEFGPKMFEAFLDGLKQKEEKKVEEVKENE